MTKKKAPQLFKCTYNIIYNIRIHICICIYMEWICIIHIYICIHTYTITCLSLYLYVSFVSFIPWCAGDLRSLAWQWGVATKCEAYNSCVLLLFGWCIFIDVDTLQAGSFVFVLQTKWKGKNVDTFKLLRYEFYMFFCLVDGLIGGLAGWLIDCFIIWLIDDLLMLLFVHVLFWQRALC